MDVKPTFFSITGFLVPGIVTLLACYILLPPTSFDWVYSLTSISSITSKDDPTAFLKTTLVVTCLLTVAFFIGSIVSELFLLGVRFWFRKPFTGDKVSAFAKKALANKTLIELLKNDLDAREVFAFSRTSNIDLHWFAGRIRMMGGSSLSLVLVALAAFFFSNHCYRNLAVLLIGAVGIGVALYRTYRFDQYVATVTATLYLAGPPPPQPKQDE